MTLNPKETCRICSQESKELFHLDLYVFGSEGINVCLECRISITEYVRGMVSACIRSRKVGYLACKKITKAKNELITKPIN